MSLLRTFRSTNIPFQTVNRGKNEYKHGHEQFEQISNYLRENNLSAEEAADGFRIMSLIKKHPPEAIKALAPYLKELALATGQTLPDDIREKVDDGFLDEETGRELAQVGAEKAKAAAADERTVSCPKGSGCRCEPVKCSR